MNDATPRTAAGGWRWPLVPFASVAMAVFAAIVVATLQDVALALLGGYVQDGAFHRYLYPALPSAAGGYLLAGTAHFIAPAAKRRAGIAMAAVMGVVLLGFAAFVWTIAPGGDAIRTTAGSLAAIAAAALALWQAERDAQSDRQLA